MQRLISDKFKIGADAAAVAGPVGRTAEASTDWKMNAELLTYSRSKGLLVGINLDGTSVSKNTDDTDEFYGAAHATREILHGDVPCTNSARSPGFLVGRAHTVAEREASPRMSAGARAQR